MGVISYATYINIFIYKYYRNVALAKHIKLSKHFKGLLNLKNLNSI